MVTLKSLKRQIKAEKAKKAKIEEKVLEQQKIRSLQSELKKLKRTPSQVRTSRLIRRTGRGLKVLGKKVVSAAVRQGKRIRKQQLRDLAAARKREKLLRTSSKKNKTKRNIQEDFFTGLEGLNFGN